MTRGHTRFASDADMCHPPSNRLSPEGGVLRQSARYRCSGRPQEQEQAASNTADRGRLPTIAKDNGIPKHGWYSTCRASIAGDHDPGTVTIGRSGHLSKRLLRYLSAFAQLAARSGSTIGRRVKEVMGEPPPVGTEQAALVRAGGVTLHGLLGVPAEARGVILFAHGSGSGRFSPRNNFVARKLQAGGFATLLVDLLEESEADDRRKVFDIALLADRLLAAKAWLEEDPRTRTRLIGYFGASTGAGAALQAAAREPASIGAVVSRGGRPDLAERYLPLVAAPTLLIIGGEDLPVVQMNKEAFVQLTCPKELVIVPGATHLFEEQGALEQVADHAQRWFQLSLNQNSGEHPRT